MDLVSKYQGYVGRVLRNDYSDSSQDSYIERLLDRVSDGVLADDRKNAMAELQSVVTESHSAQLAFGARGFQVFLKVLKEERDDVEMVRAALETIVCALTPLGHVKAAKNEVQPALMNSDLLSTEVDNISLLLSLLTEDDFYVRYYTLQILTALLNNSPNRLQEAILTIPRGVTGLMDMLMEREVIRNEALLLLTYLTREAEEIQKIVVFEGAFEKIFSIINEEGGSEGGIVVQDCLQLLNNLLRHNASNQVLLRETMGFDNLLPILRLRGSTHKFNQQKTINILSVLETIHLLIMGGPEADPGKDANSLTNKTVLVQKKVLEHLLMLGVESQWAPIAVRCMALQCIGDLISSHPQNRDILASMVLGEGPDVEPALNSILRIILRSSNTQEFLAADYVFKIFCEKNTDGQAMLASTLIPQPHLMTHAPFEEDIHMSFGSMLLHGLTMSENDGDLETCCRAASVLSHVLKDNSQCKERVLRIELEAPMASLGGSEPLMHRMVKYLALSSSVKNNDVKSGGADVQLFILKLLVVWFCDCPSAVQCFLDSRPHLTYLLELVSNPAAASIVKGLTAVLLGECVVHNKSGENGKDALSIADTIGQKIGLATYFSMFDELHKSLPSKSIKPSLSRRQLTRSSASSMAEIEDYENEATDPKNDHPDSLIVSYTFSSEFVDLLKHLQSEIRDRIVDVYSHPIGQVEVLPAELEQKHGESDRDYIQRLKPFVEKQCHEMQDLLNRNATLVGEMSRTSGKGSSQLDHKPSAASENFQVEALRRDIQEASKRLEIMRAEKAKIESEASDCQNLAAKTEADLKSLSDAYNSLEQTNFHLEKELKSLKNSGAISIPDVADLKAEAREEAQKGMDAELNDLLVCLGQEQSKVERLSTRLTELGEDVDKLLEGVGDETGVPEDEEEEDDDEE